MDYDYTRRIYSHNNRHDKSKKNKHAHRNKPNKDSAKPGAWTKCTDFGEAYYAFLETFTESQM